MAQSYIAIPICKSSSKRWISVQPAQPGHFRLCLESGVAACMAQRWLRGGIASPPAGETRSSGLIGSPRWREARRVGLLLRRARRAEAVAVSGYAQLELILAGWNAEAVDDCQPESRRRIKDPNSLGGVRGGPTKIQATIWAKQDQVEVVGRIMPPVSQIGRASCRERV